MLGVRESTAVQYFSDRLLVAPYRHTTRATGYLESLEAITPTLSEEIVDGWHHETYPNVAAELELLRTVACSPRLLEIVRSSRPSTNTAEEVLGNFQTLSQHVTGSPHLRPETLGYFLNNDIVHGSINGQMAQTAIFGVLWWGIARGMHGRALDVLPATPSERAQKKNRADGCRTDIDAVLRTRDADDDGQPIAIRTKRPKKIHITPYIPGVAVVAVENLRDSAGVRLKGGTRKILSFLAEDNEPELTTINKTLARYFNNAQAELVEHQTCQR